MRKRSLPRLSHLEKQAYALPGWTDVLAPRPLELLAEAGSDGDGGKKGGGGGGSGDGGPREEAAAKEGGGGKRKRDKGEGKKKKLEAKRRS